MRLTVDLYSGKPNPSWTLPSLFSKQVFDLLGDNGLLRHTASPFPARLGYRGLQIGLPAELAQKYKAPHLINLSADSPVSHLPLFRELAGIVQFASFLGIGEELIRLIKMILKLLQKSGAGGGGGGGAPPAGPCAFEMLAFDPNYWNDPAFKPTNNCYAYASNKRAAYSDKPQPGLGSGAMFASLTGADVKAAAIRDGAHIVTDCFPDSEAPRHLVALVIWPGEDYHWYRKHPDCWGHKPGSTAARNVDSSGAVIQNPETCDRGPYTEFTCYMLIPKSQKVAA